MSDGETTMTTQEPANTASQAGGSPVQSPPPQGHRTGLRKSHAGLIIAVILCVGVGLFIHSGIHSRVEAEAALKSATRAAAVPSVLVIHPTPGSASGELVLPGNTQAFIDTPIYARTSGYLKKWYVDIGGHVRRGQLLAEIETPELDQQLQQAEGDLKSAQASLNLAEITAARWKHLLETDSVSKQETDQAISDLNSKQALVNAAEANVRRLRQLQSYERIYAPFDGVITARNTDIGDLIAAGANTTPRELFHLAAINRLRVYIPVPEVDAASVHTGEKATLTTDEYPGQKFTGTLVRDSDAIDPASRTLNVEVDVDNAKNRLLPGAYVFVHLAVPPSTGAVTIPSNTLLFRSEGLRVAVVRDGKVHLVPIVIGHDYGSTVEVLSGISAQDKIVIDPSDSIEDGQSVEIAANGVQQ
jgi:RND family efflux transporter MFP subunit